MIVDDFPICNDASLFAKDFREDLLAKFGLDSPILSCSSKLPPHEQETWPFCPKVSEFACSRPLPQKMLLQLLTLGNLMQ